MPGEADESVQPDSVLLADVTLDAGLGDVPHVNGMSGRLYMPEVIGSGAALFDPDCDGDLDIWLVTGHSLPDRQPGDPSDRLMRNLWVERGELRFEDATAEFGIRAEGYGMGIAVGDVNNDGFPDVYVTQLGQNQLWINKQGRHFEARTEPAGLLDDGVWSSSATFGDLDGDGLLDLYVANYVDFSFETHKTCRLPSGVPEYCGPTSYNPLPDRIYRNAGDGRFEDMTPRSGILRHPASGLGVVSGDFQETGNLELYVANDMMPNQLWSVDESWNFENRALISGSAVNSQGRPEASMGIAVGDVDGDGWEDLLITHLESETHTLYLGDGAGGFADDTHGYQLGVDTLEATGFGTAFADFDLDGWLDLVVANGGVTKIEAQVKRGDPYPLGQPNQLFRFIPDPVGGRFREISERVDPSFRALEVSRGLAVGDLDQNGAPDVLVMNNAGLPRLYMNRLRPEPTEWLGVQVMDERWNRVAVGARVVLRTTDGRSRLRVVRRDGSFASSHDPRVLFGLEGQVPQVLEIRWPDGHQVEIQSPSTGRYLHVNRSGLMKEP